MTRPSITPVNQRGTNRMTKPPARVALRFELGEGLAEEREQLDGAIGQRLIADPRQAAVTQVHLAAYGTDARGRHGQTPGREAAKAPL